VTLYLFLGAASVVSSFVILWLAQENGYGLILRVLFLSEVAYCTSCAYFLATFLAVEFHRNRLDRLIWSTCRARTTFVLAPNEQT
jgi:hypothetical protein